MVQYYSVQKRYYSTIKLQFNVKTCHHNISICHYNVTKLWYILVTNLEISLYDMIVSIDVIIIGPTITWNYNDNIWQ